MDPLILYLLLVVLAIAVCGTALMTVQPPQRSCQSCGRQTSQQQKRCRHCGDVTNR